MSKQDRKTVVTSCSASNENVAVRTATAVGSQGRASYALIFDAVSIVVFAVVGRASHQEADPVVGVLITAWPFLAGAGAGWLIGRLWQAPLQLWPHGACLWLITLLTGVVLRLLSGRSAEWSFIVVAAAVLALFLLGHRAVGLMILRRIERRQ